MLRCLLFLTSGTATVLGFDIKDRPQTIKEIIGVSPQETAIAPRLSAFENLTVMGGVYGMPWRKAAARAKGLMKLMELDNRRDQSRKLSGGMQRRLSIAMALMPDPEVLFLDEPTLCLDPHARKAVWNYFEKLKHEKTILLTTHYLEEADALADHIAFIDSAKIIAEGTSAQSKNKYCPAKILTLTLDIIPAGIADRLRKAGMDVQQTEKGLEIRASDPDLSAITGLLSSDGARITGINMQEPSLNEVFLKLTGKDVKDESLCLACRNLKEVYRDPVYSAGTAAGSAVLYHRYSSWRQFYQHTLFFPGFLPSAGYLCQPGHDHWRAFHCQPCLGGGLGTTDSH
jgi:ABC-2 type transport system ATP-binding protein